jgi:hypothetical protein
LEASASARWIPSPVDAQVQIALVEGSWVTSIASEKNVKICFKTVGCASNARASNLAPMQRRGQEDEAAHKDRIVALLN